MAKNKPYLPKLIATSVVRGSEQGDSHGGIFSVDFDQQEVSQHVDWNTSDIDFSGRGWDRGLRGIGFHNDEIYIAASDELFVYKQDFRIQRSFRNPYLKHCHEICKKDNLLFLTSTGYDSILVFDLLREEFTWGLCIERQHSGWQLQQFNPGSTEGPEFVNNLHLNMVSIHDTGVYFSGLHTGAMLRIGKDFRVSEVCNLPAGSHNARPFKDGILFNDTKSDCVRYVDSERRPPCVQNQALPGRRNPVCRYRRFENSPAGVWPGTVPFIGPVYRGRFLTFHDHRIRSLHGQDSYQRQSLHGYQECDSRPGSLAVRLTWHCRQQKTVIIYD